VEFWEYLDKIKKTTAAATLMHQHQSSGFAHQPHAGPMGETFGDTSMSLFFMEQLPGWKLDGYDRSLVDSYQITLCMRPRVENARKGANQHVATTAAA
jgi:hypothetical protein